MGIFEKINFMIRSGRLYQNQDVREIVLNEDSIESELDKYFSEDEREELKEMAQEKKELGNKLGNKRSEVKELKKRVKDLQEIDSDLPKYRDKWNSKHSRKGVKYRRPVWSGDELGSYNVPVVNFITPHDPEIENALLDEGLSIDNPLEANEIIPEIYHLAKEHYDYEYDSHNLGWVEFWQFPFETRINDGDCEDWAHVIASFLIAAGLPSFRVRVVAGGTLDEDYGGHSTVYVLADDMETWYHLNSTSPEQHHDNLTEYPEWGVNEGLNIDPNDVWVAFNDKNSWQDFETPESMSNYENSGLSDKLVVTR